MQRPVPLAVDEFYHCYNRGVEKREIFSNQSDYERFINLLYLANSDKAIVFEDINEQNIFAMERGEPIVAVGAYCLMPNHFHLLLREIKEGGITQFMRKLCTGYSMYFNKKYEHSGVLFQGRFKAKHADSDEYLRHLATYIHLNPLDLIQSGWKKNGVRDSKYAEEFLKKYSYSSLHDYVSDAMRQEIAIINKDLFPAYYSSAKEILEDIREWQELIPTFDKI